MARYSPAIGLILSYVAFLLADLFSQIAPGDAMVDLGFRV